MMNTLERRIVPYMPTEAPMYRTTDIDMQRWSSEGVRGIVWDVEGTLGVTGSAELEPHLVAMFAIARDLGIDNHALLTNHSIKTKRDRELLRGWQDQTDADLVLPPLEARRRKPSSYMHEQAMEQFVLKPEQMGAIGDKATADMVAAYRAGFEHRAWTRTIEGHQHPGDVILRRPPEVLLRLKAHLLFGELGVVKPEVWLPSRELDEPLSPGDPDGLDRIVGFGIPDILLDDTVLESLKEPASRRALSSLQTFAQKKTEIPAKALEDFLFEHGREVATALTYSRLVIATGIVAVSLSSLDNSTKRKINAGLLGLAYVTDFLDGKASRADKDGPTIRGAQEDQRIDKVLSVIADVFGLLPVEAITKLQAAIPVARDGSMQGLRTIVEKYGMYTASVASGKKATAVKGGAQVLGLALGHRNPDTNRVLQTVAAGFKVTSGIDSVESWTLARELRVHEHNNLARLATV